MMEDELLCSITESFGKRKGLYFAPKLLRFRSAVFELELMVADSDVS